MIGQLIQQGWILPPTYNYRPPAAPAGVLVDDTQLFEMQHIAFQARKQQIKLAQDDYLNGKASEHPPVYSILQLKLSIRGIAPIPFTQLGIEEGRLYYKQFKLETVNALIHFGIIDAQITIIGSSYSGFRGNPNKEFGPWSLHSDMDIAIISKIFSDLCRQNKIAKNVNFLIDGKPVLYKNGGPDGVHQKLLIGFALNRIEAKWSVILRRQVEFKISIEAIPLKHGISFFSH